MGLRTSFQTVVRMLGARYQVRSCSYSAKSFVRRSIKGSVALSVVDGWRGSMSVRGVRLRCSVQRIHRDMGCKAEHCLDTVRQLLHLHIPFHNGITSSSSLASRNAFTRQ